MLNYTRKARILAGLWIACSFASAQEEEPLVFHSGTTLVEFTVTAYDSKERPVVDLSAEEVSIREGGQERAVAFFRFEGGKQDAAAPSLPAGNFSNRPAVAPGPPRNVTAILLDTLNTAPQDQIFARRQVMKYLHEIEPNTRVAVYELGRNLGVVHDFTNDPVALRASIERVETRLAMQGSQDIADLELGQQLQIASLPASMADELEDGIYFAIETELLANEGANERRALKTLAALELLGDHLAGIPGRKSLVWVTGGIPMVSITGMMGNGQRGGIKSYESWVTATGRRLATQGVAIYAVDARGLVGIGETHGLSTMNRSIERLDLARDQMARYRESVRINTDPWPALEKLAGITGGRALFNTNDMSAGVKAAAADVEGTYTLGFYAVDEPDDKWRDVSVRIARRGVSVRHRDGYMAKSPAVAAENWTQLQWRAAIGSPVSATALPVDAKGEVSRTGQGDAVTLIVQIDTDSLRYRADADGSRGFVELALVEKQRDGAFGIQVYPIEVLYGQSDPGATHQFRRSWLLDPDAVGIRVIVRDQLSGLYGTLDLPVDQLPRDASLLE